MLALLHTLTRAPTGHYWGQFSRVSWMVSFAIVIMIYSYIAQAEARVFCVYTLGREIPALGNRSFPSLRVTSALVTSDLYISLLRWHFNLHPCLPFILPATWSWCHNRDWVFNVHCDALQQDSFLRKAGCWKKNRQKDTTEQAVKRSWEEVTPVGAAGKSSSQLLMSRPMYAVSLSQFFCYFLKCFLISDECPFF